MTFAELNEAAGRIAKEAGCTNDVVIQITGVGYPIKLAEFLVMVDGRGMRANSADEALMRFADMLNVKREHRAAERLSLLGELPEVVS